MRRLIPKPLMGVISLSLYTANFFFWGIILVSVALLQYLNPMRKWRHFIVRLTDHILYLWTDVNQLIMWLTTRTQWVVRGIDALNPKEWYLLIANHQSWIDILMISAALNRKVPMFKYFIKRQLLWVPIIGQSAWLLRHPFMKRYSKAYLAKYPERQGQDVETTRKACEYFKNFPITMVNFAEGTRFTKQKHQQQKSPFTHLLKPKAGGVAFVLATMGDYLKKIINVTLIYDNSPTLWNFMTGKIKKVVIDVKSLPITEKLLGDYQNDLEFRKHFQEWLNQLWIEKDKLITYEKTNTYSNTPKPSRALAS